MPDLPDPDERYPFMAHISKQVKRSETRHPRLGPQNHPSLILVSGAKADELQLLPREECGLEQLDTALDRLALAVPQIKKRVLEAFVHVVGADGLIQEREAELLRAIADTLDCPIPPFVQIAESQQEELMYPKRKNDQSVEEREQEFTITRTM